MPRTRSLPEAEVLERALYVFWARGYDRASIADICDATGLGPSSIYNAFGSKIELFRKSLAHYLGKYATLATEHLDDAFHAHESMRNYLRGIVRLCVMPNTPPGCLLMQSGGAGIPEDSEACAATNEIKTVLTQSIRNVLEARHTAGDTLSASPGTLAMFVVATTRGISQLACDGVSEDELLCVADHAAMSCIKQ
ncbi:MAG: TetR/AcrR family transcriptional regulator [Phycisphaerales bacterium]|nr:TetR/AcrR family transcriptional regulator [Phycisphaerales bacterium]